MSECIFSSGHDIVAFCFGWCGIVVGAVGLCLWRGAEKRADHYHDRFLHGLPAYGEHLARRAQQ